MKFFTHALRDEQMRKFVFHGLFDTNEIYLMQLLTTAGLKPLQVKNMTIKNKKFKLQYIKL